MTDKLFLLLEQLVITKKLTYLSKAFAEFLYEHNRNAHPVIFLVGALVSEQLNRGEVYLNVKTVADSKNIFNHIDMSELQPYFSGDWQTHFDQSTVIMEGGGNSPLVWDKTLNRVYLRRYWASQKRVDDEIIKRLAPVRDVLPAEIILQLETLFPSSDITPDWQKIACAVALRSNFCIITGGPGTGKTTTLTKLLVLSVSLLRLEKDAKFKPEILLAAPTGKAANRVSESINNALLSKELSIITDEVKTLIPKKASTLHRLLGSQFDTRLYKKNRYNPLNADIVIIDESSMIDLEMMSALLEALSENTQLILLGDKNQLSSVEPGYVFGNLCYDAEKAAYNTKTLNWIKRYTQESVTPKNQGPFLALAQQTVMLRHSYRFSVESGIGQLANVVNSSNNKMDNVDEIFNAHPNDLSKITTLNDLEKLVLGKQGNLASYLNYQNEIKHKTNYSTLDEWAEKVLKTFDNFRILCAVHEGELGVKILNQTVQGWLYPRENKTWYEGRSIMIMKNDYNLGLMNGDIGIALNISNDLNQPQIKVAFFSNDDQKAEKIRWFSTSRISNAQTAFVMTVHKSQGSEFDHTLFVLPRLDTQVLTKELIYTAITRAKKHFSLLVI